VKEILEFLKKEQLSVLQTLLTSAGHAGDTVVWFICFCCNFVLKAVILWPWVRLLYWKR